MVRVWSTERNRVSMWLLVLLLLLLLMVFIATHSAAITSLAEDGNHDTGFPSIAVVVRDKHSHTLNVYVHLPGPPCSTDEDCVPYCPPNKARCALGACYC
ncbi:hypothetical protein AQUCO_00200588v1 [Aquilegia coerulea]|uniref:Uncharacterized protein n=1 Tax=Aquilegia coerulea TaxID=218851 RepID=A0A2G5F3T4_AQUCA|nr:hypothetical protein AQUCO_00200588v1 [Aquilegia coerulea]